MALSDNYDAPEKASAFAQDLSLYTGVDSDEFYKGALLCYDQNDNKIKPGAASTTLIAIGRCEERLTTVASNTEKPKVRCGIFRFENSGTSACAAADIGNTCYVEDDNTVSKTDQTSTLSAAGKIVDVDSDGVWVAINPLV